MAEFNTNPGDRSVTELEREVDRERERVSATIDELQSRASVGSLVDQVVKAVGENGGEVSRNLGRSLRDNPLAALLTGVGLGLAHGGLGQAARTKNAIGKTPTESTSVMEAIGWQSRRPPAPQHSVAALTRIGSNAEDPDGHEASEERGLRERVADVAGRVGEGVSEAVEGVRERASELSAAAGAGLHRAGDTMRDAGGAVRHRAGAARRGAAGKGRDMRHGLDTLFEDQPLVAGAIAMALGAAVEALSRARESKIRCSVSKAIERWRQREPSPRTREPRCRRPPAPW